MHKAFENITVSELPTQAPIDMDDKTLCICMGIPEHLAGDVSIESLINYVYDRFDKMLGIDKTHPDRSKLYGLITLQQRDTPLMMDKMDTEEKQPCIVADFLLSLSSITDPYLIGLFNKAHEEVVRKEAEEQAAIAIAVEKAGVTCVPTKTDENGFPAVDLD